MPSARSDSEKLLKAQAKIMMQQAKIMRQTPKKIRVDTPKKPANPPGQQIKREAELCPVCGKPNGSYVNSYARPAPCSEDCRLEIAWADVCQLLYRETEYDRLPDKEGFHEIMAWDYDEAMKREDNRFGLLAIGPTRLGKTRSLYMLLKRYFWKGKSVRVFETGDFGRECAEAFRSLGGLKWFNSIVRVDLVLLDDHGREKKSESSGRSMFDLFEKRTSRKLPTFISTNFSGMEIKNKYLDDAYLARLREFCQIVTFQDRSANP